MLFLYLKINTRWFGNLSPSITAMFSNLVILPLNALQIIDISCNYPLLSYGSTWILLLKVKLIDLSHKKLFLYACCVYQKETFARWSSLPPHFIIAEIFPAQLNPKTKPASSKELQITSTNHLNHFSKPENICTFTCFSCNWKAM